MNNKIEFALITGASNGIGLELSRVFAKNNYGIIAVARNRDNLEILKNELQNYGSEVHVLVADLSDFNEIKKVEAEVENHKWNIDTIVLNAGQGLGGDFIEHTDLEAELKLIRLNVDSYVHLSKIFFPKLIERGRGSVLMTSSVSGTTPIPYEAVYGATKAFVNSFFWAVRNELKGKGINMTLLMPGATETNFFINAGLGETTIGSGEKDDARDVAERAWYALQSGHEYVYGSEKAEYEGDVLNRIQSESQKAQRHRIVSEPKK
ncbi:DEHA2E24288p [Debaryomyces hansenii CBS767]|uniref:DEHA2E24288p n=1 Tax=Debaryomyces hansenii (strain ATCC 36239 / CBS 767 / BCRC 21394 / JCM 1990 / NBRC 0083 / IGC 2968) TaxID=284592 RepID=Q6BN63_DEBHA|nr:DEHA2E24288p [Debaryomyces hansenii CBS767]CAG88648.2 DEHA2E24288p [Debaryomyces hansenii CBS767]|eukprot:XP_460357.2 DEHA2E24288p [Debaryomyces hansenii CBS767]